MLESELKAWFMSQVRERIPHVEMHEPKTIRRGKPDLYVLGPGAGPGAWAAFDFKADRGADHQPNQDFVIDYLDDMAWAEFVYPDNAEEILDGLERLFPAI